MKLTHATLASLAKITSQKSARPAQSREANKPYNRYQGGNNKYRGGNNKGNYKPKYQGNDKRGDNDKSTPRKGKSGGYKGKASNFKKDYKKY
jgi:hypothetical protein